MARLTSRLTKFKQDEIRRKNVVILFSAWAASILVLVKGKRWHRDLLLCNYQFTRTVRKSTRLVNEWAVFIPSTLTMLEPLMCSVTKRQPGRGGGQCCIRDWMARLISTAVRMTTNEASEIWAVNFGSDWTRFIAWQNNEAGFGWILKTRLEKQLMPSTISLVWLVRMANTNWVLEHTLVRVLTLLPFYQPFCEDQLTRVGQC